MDYPWTAKTFILTAMTVFVHLGSTLPEGMCYYKCMEYNKTSLTTQIYNKMNFLQAISMKPNGKIIIFERIRIRLYSR